MVRPAQRLTERELELMHVFWKCGDSTVDVVRSELAKSGRNLAHSTVFTLVRILSNKHFLEQVTHKRPYLFRPVCALEDVAKSLLCDLVRRMFGGSWKELFEFVAQYRLELARCRLNKKDPGGARP